MLGLNVLDILILILATFIVILSVAGVFGMCYELWFLARDVITKTHRSR